VITRAELKARLADAMGEEWRAQLALDGQDEATIALRHRKSQERITGAPAIIVPCLYLEDLDVYPDAERQAAETTMAIQSLGCAIQNMLLAAYALGLDTGWMCAPLFSPATVRAALDLASSLHPHALIPVGYAAKDPVRRPRRPLDELVVRWE
jgi:F420 biosynthesis protein FbiB-like protein